MLTAEQLAQYRQDGYVIVDGVLSEAEVGTLIDAIDRLERAGQREAQGVSWSDNQITLIQNLPCQPAPLSRVLRYRPVLALVEQIVGAVTRVTGGLLLDKDPKHNWDIVWHQDNGIYAARVPPGEANDVRAGMPVYNTRGMELARNVTCRIALDASSPETGGLYLFPGSHATNLWPECIGPKKFAQEKGVGTTQSAGSMMCYNPLLLHRSEKSAATSGRRRVLALQYGPADLMLPGTMCYPFPQPVPLTAVDRLVE